MEKKLSDSEMEMLEDEFIEYVYEKYPELVNLLKEVFISGSESYEVVWKALFKIVRDYKKSPEVVVKLIVNANKNMLYDVYWNYWNLDISEINTLDDVDKYLRKLRKERYDDDDYIDYFGEVINKVHL